MNIFTRKNNNVHELIMEQIKDVEECLINFEGFMRAATTPATVKETLRPLSVGVQKSEAVADLSLRRMIDSLSEGSYLPSTRQDLISIATSCDSVANKCEHVAKIMVFQDFRFPEEFADDIMKVISITREQFSVLEESISTLFSNFGAILKDHEILDRIRQLESQVDVIEANLYEKAFDLDMDFAHHMQLATFVELVCDPSDVIENIADKIQILLITRKA